MTKVGDSLGLHECTGCGCNCGEVEHTLYNTEYMRCSNCECTAPRADARLMIRLYVHGKMTVKAMEEAIEIARLLGVRDTALFVTENPLAHYIESSLDGVRTNLEIAKIKGQ